jgi:transcriptional regulator
MHPSPDFAWTDRPAMLAFVGEVGLCTICVSGPALVHAPVVVYGADRLRFHVARRNPAAPALAGARAIASCLGPDAYVSPDFYGSADQVPTWNYVAVEAEGPLRRLEEAELVDLLDRLGEIEEAKLAPKPPWTRAKLSDARFVALLRAIEGYELAIEELRGTRKLGQNKRPSERLGAAAGVAQCHPEMGALMRDEPGPRA